MRDLSLLVTHVNKSIERTASKNWIETGRQSNLDRERRGARLDHWVQLQADLDLTDPEKAELKRQIGVE